MTDPYTRKRRQSSAIAVDDTRVDVAEAPTLAEVPISAKSLNPGQQKRVRAALAELDEAAPNQTELASGLGVKQQTVSRVLGGGTVGMKVALAVAAARGQTLEELLGGAARPRTYADVDGWHEASQRAIDEKLARRYVIREVATWPASLPVAHVELDLVLDLCNLWIRYTPRETRLALDTAEAHEDLGRAERDAKVTKHPHARGQKQS